MHFHVPCVPHDKPKVSTKSQQRQGKGRAAYGGFETDWFQASEVERAERVEVGAGLCICLDRLPEWVLCCGLVELCSYQRQMSAIAFRLPSCSCIVDLLAELSFLQNCSFKRKLDQSTVRHRGERGGQLTLQLITRLAEPRAPLVISCSSLGVMPTSLECSSWHEVHLSLSMSVWSSSAGARPVTLVYCALSCSASR